MNKKIINWFLVFIFLVALFLDVVFFITDVDQSNEFRTLWFIPHALVLFCVFLLVGLNPEIFVKLLDNLTGKWSRNFFSNSTLKKRKIRIKNRINFFRKMGYWFA